MHATTWPPGQRLASLASRSAYSPPRGETARQPDHLKQQQPGWSEAGGQDKPFNHTVGYLAPASASSIPCSGTATVYISPPSSSSYPASFSSLPHTPSSAATFAGNEGASPAWPLGYTPTMYSTYAYSEFTSPWQPLAC